jgi:hypothetical protein
MMADVIQADGTTFKQSILSHMCNFPFKNGCVLFMQLRCLKRRLSKIFFLKAAGPLPPSALWRVWMQYIKFLEMKLFLEVYGSTSTPSTSGNSIAEEGHSWVRKEGCYLSRCVSNPLLIVDNCSLGVRPIQRCGLIARHQSTKLGIYPKSSRTCCSLIQRVGTSRPVLIVTTGPNSCIARSIPSAWWRSALCRKSQMIALLPSNH